MTHATIILESGGRKTAHAHVKLVPASENMFLVNNQSLSAYFQNNPVFLKPITTVYDLLETDQKFSASIKVEGGGLSGQAQATKLALSKAFLGFFPNSRGHFKKEGFLTRDARIKERRKYGLKKARKASQFSKR